MSSALSILLLPELAGGAGPRFKGVVLLTELVPHAPVPSVSENEAGISSHSSPCMSSLFKKNGQSFTRRDSDSFASATEMGTCEDCTTATATSEAGNARRFLPGVAKLPLVGAENFLRTCKYDVKGRLCSLL